MLNSCLQTAHLAFSCILKENAHDRDLSDSGGFKMENESIKARMFKSPMIDNKMFTKNFKVFHTILILYLHVVSCHMFICQALLQFFPTCLLTL